MKIKVIDCEQRSPEWFAARAGRLTGSVAVDMLSKIKSGESAGRRNLRVKLAVERITGKPIEDDFETAEMRRGRELEPLAFGAYEADSGHLVQRTGFISGELMVGASLDGHIGDFDGIIEMKIPNSATHLEYLRDARVPPKYLPQVRHNVWLTGAKWAEFISFDDRFPEDLQLFRCRITREELDLPEYEAEVSRFLAEVNVEVSQIRDMQKRKAA